MYQSRTPERCDHRSAYFTNLVTRTERGYRVRCPQCGASGPVRLSTEAARRALADVGRRSDSAPRRAETAYEGNEVVEQAIIATPDEVATRLRGHTIANSRSP